MTPYLQLIWNRLVRRYQLRNFQNDKSVRILSREHEVERIGGAKNFTIFCTRYVLTYHKELHYIDFQEQRWAKRFHQCRLRAEILEDIDQHLTVNAIGTIRRMYNHRGTQVATVRTISLRNYYLIQDNQVARCIMCNTDDLAWIHSIPVTFYPISNNRLNEIKTLNDLFLHFAGKDAQIPKRIQHALPLGELLMLLQLVPGAYLNAIAATLKREPDCMVREPLVPHIVLSYYRHALTDGNSLKYQTAYSYVCSCRGLETKLNMGIKSVRRIEQDQQKLRKKRKLDRLPEIRTHKDLVLKQTDFGELKIELIDSKKRLYEEASMMKSCVGDYAREIIDGRCSLYHIRYRRRRYTLEVERDEKGWLTAVQLSGVENAPATARLRAQIDHILKKEGNVPRKR